MNQYHNIMEYENQDIPVSVIVVCFNESNERISYTMDSIVRQDYSNIDLVIVDGGSCKETIKAFEKYKHCISKFLSEKDKGLYDAMNKGLKMASGDWIIFMNIGDRFHSENVLSLLIKEISSAHLNSVDMVYGNIMVKEYNAPLSYEYMSDYFNRWYLYRGYICHQAVLAHSRVFKKIGSFDTKYSLIADRDWFLRFITAGFLSKHVDYIVCDWERGGMCSDFDRVKNEWQRYVSMNYSFFDRFCYEILWGIIKLWRRIKTRNFKLPAVLRKSKNL